MAIYGNMVVPSRARGAGALPTDESDRKVYVPGSEVSGRFSDQGGVLAGQAAQQAAAAAGKSNEGLRDLAKGIGALSPMFVAIHERNQRLDMAKAQEAFSRLQNEYIEKQREWSQIKGANTVNMEELKSRWWDEAMPRLTQGLGDYGRRYFNMHADRVGAMADTFIQNHQEREINSYESTQLKVAMDAEANMINLDPYNPSASVGRIQALIHQDCQRKGLPPDVEQQMVRQALGTAFGNAVAIQLQQGRLAEAKTLFAQYQQLIPADQAAKLNEGYNAGLLQQAGALMQSGNVQGLQALFAGAANPSGVRQFGDGVIEARARQMAGTPYPGVGKGLDCSAYVRRIAKDRVPPQYQNIFDGSSEHMLVEAGKATGHLFKGGEVNPSIVQGGWLIGIAEPNAAHVKNDKSRTNKIGHVALTYVNSQGQVMVTETSSGRGVHDTPLADWLRQQNGKQLFGADLNRLPGGNRGVPSGGTVNVLPQYKPMLEQAAQQAGVDPVLLQAIAMQESDGGRDLRTSKAGAVGLMQIMPSVAKEIGGNRDNMQDNIRMGAQYFAKMLKMSGGDVREALLRYNWGPGNVDTWKKTGKGVNGQDMPAEAREYADRVLGHIKGGSVGAQSQQQAQMQAMPSGVDQSKWDAMYKNARGDAELAAVGYKMGYAKAMEWADGGRKVESLPKDVQAFLREVKQNGGQPKTGASQAQAPAMPQTGFGSQQAGGLSATPATLERLQANYMPQAEATRIWQEASSMKGTERQTFILRQLQGLSANPTMQGDVARILMPQLSQQEKIEEAESRQRAEDWGAKIKGENYLSAGNTIRQAIGNGQITEQEGAMALNFAFGKKEDNVGTRAAAVQIMEDIDRGNITSRQQVEAACLGGRCTDAQTHKCLEYLEKGGQKDQVKISRINDVWREWMFSQGKTVKDGEKIPYELANYVYADMTPGKIPSSSEIKASIAEGMLKGKGVFGSNYAYEAWAKNDNDWEYEDIPEGLKQQGVTSRAQMWSRVDNWIHEKRPDLKPGQITDAMRRAAMREMMTMPRWGLTEENARRAN